MKNLKNKAVIVTGAAAGIGRKIAEGFLNEGSAVLLVDLNQDNLSNTINELNSANAIACPADVSKEDDWRKIVNLALSNFGKIDIIINNAGILNKPCMVDKIASEEAHRIVEVNIFGVLFGMQAVIPQMRKQGQGVIINIASLSAHKPTLGYSIYGASKAAVANLTLTAAHELAKDNIRVVAVSPGVADTGINPPDVKAQIAKKVPLRKMASPEDVANLALFLASDKAGHITAETYIISGGQRT